MKKKEEVEVPKASCCKAGTEAIYIFKEKKKKNGIAFLEVRASLMYDGEEWWLDVDYCPWCGTKLI